MQVGGSQGPAQVSPPFLLSDMQEIGSGVGVECGWIVVPSFKLSWSYCLPLHVSVKASNSNSFPDEVLSEPGQMYREKESLQGNDGHHNSRARFLSEV